MLTAKLGVIGGSGLYDIDNLKIINKYKIKTPFGKTSDPISVGTFGNGINIAFLSRHGEGHRLLPSEVPSKANIYALKKIGVESILSISAVGSLQQEIKPTDIVIPDQIIDRTKHRANSFFGNGIAGHVGFADPFCKKMRDLLIESIEKTDIKIHKNGTYVCMEGPLFSTRAESNLYRKWDASIIGMTAIPEAKLAREAEICYAMISLVTDYDCWHEEEEDVTVDIVIQNVKKNISSAKQIIKTFSDLYTNKIEECSCKTAAKYAVMTNKNFFPKKTKKKLGLFYNKYWS